MGSAILGNDGLVRVPRQRCRSSTVGECRYRLPAKSMALTRAVQLGVGGQQGSFSRGSAVVERS